MSDTSPIPSLPPEFCWNDTEHFPPKTSFLARIPGLASVGFSCGLLYVVACAAGAFKRGRISRRELFWRCSRAEIDLINRYGGDITAEGLHHVKSLDGKPCVIIGNHMSMIETFVLPALTLPWADTTFVVKESLMRTPSMGTILKAVDAIAVGRSNPREDLKTVLEEGERLLSEGRTIVIFPQSTRSVEFDPSSFSSIGAKLAKNAGVPVVPLALRTDFLLNGSIVKELGRINPERPPIRFAFAPPILDTSDAKKVQQDVLDFIAVKTREWGVAEKLKEKS